MRRFFLFASAAIAVAVAFSGCDSVDSLPTRVRERFETPQPKTRVFEAEQRAVFDAAVVALRRIDFTVTRAAAAQGMVRGRSAIESGGPVSDARQFSIEVKIEAAEAGRTEVAVLLRKQEESSSFAGATDIPLREHGLYESYFSALERALKEKPAVPANAP